MRIGVIGCAHGELNRIYSSLPASAYLLLICGDFLSARDFESMSVPEKYKKLGDFEKYFRGELKAPCLTIFIGGNHECSNYLWELYYGGYVAPNIYYLGQSSLISVGGISIAGISGIHNERDCNSGYFESFPFRGKHVRSIYHTRSFEVFKLQQIKKPIDIFLSHDWPKNICHYGNLEELLERKPFFKTDIKTGNLGNPALEQLLLELKPKNWFSAHLHVKFEAVVRHADRETKFMALDKCLPRRQFLHIFEMGSPVKAPLKVKIDKDWISILRATQNLFPRGFGSFMAPQMLNIAQNNESFIPEFDKSGNKKFCAKFQLPDPKELLNKPSAVEENPDEIALD